VLLHYLAKWETRKLHFHLNAVLVHCLNSTTCLISLIIWLMSHTHAAVWLPNSCNQCVQLVRSAWGCSEAMVQDKRSWECCRSWTVLHAQCTSALSSGFPISQGTAEALDRWRGKTKHHLISYFLSKVEWVQVLHPTQHKIFWRHSPSQSLAKNYRNRIVYMKTIASQRWDDFFETQCRTR